MFIFLINFPIYVIFIQCSNGVGATTLLKYQRPIMIAAIQQTLSMEPSTKLAQQVSPLQATTLAISFAPLLTTARPLDKRSPLAWNNGGGTTTTLLLCATSVASSRFFLPLLLHFS